VMGDVVAFVMGDVVAFVNLLFFAAMCCELNPRSAASRPKAPKTTTAPRGSVPKGRGFLLQMLAGNCHGIPSTSTPGTGTLAGNVPPTGGESQGETVESYCVTGTEIGIGKTKAGSRASRAEGDEER